VLGPTRDHRIYAPVMKDSLIAGISGAADFEVTADMSPPHLAPRIVLSTPSMIQLMEQTSLQAMTEHLDGDETTVGTHVCVSHVAAAGGGDTVTIRFELAEVVKRRLKFNVSAHLGDTVLSEGTHERAVIKTS